MMKSFQNIRHSISTTLTGIPWEVRNSDKINRTSHPEPSKSFRSWFKALTHKKLIEG
jgi:hypothetical protein